MSQETSFERVAFRFSGGEKLSHPSPIAFAIVVIGHGSREAAANVELQALVDGWARRRAPDADVTLGYVELAQPTVADALAAAARTHAEVVALPLFLFTAGHVKNDLPLALAAARAQFPDVKLTSARALGVQPALAEQTWERALAAAPALADPDAAKRSALLVVGRGSSDPDANGDFVKQTRLVAEGRGLGVVEPAFLGITGPSVEEALERLARARPERIVVAPYLLTAGRLIEKLRGQLDLFHARYPWIAIELAAHLGADARLEALLDQRVNEARHGAEPLACDGCQYRTPLPGRERNVGGLRALLWSLRHTFTHAQAAPHVHAHKPLTKHVLVCVNADCAERGSVGLVDELRRKLKDAGHNREIKITKTSCMGRCGEGPTVVVYPDGIWYRGVVAADAGELVQEHLLGDRLLARLVDNIMQ